MKIYSVLVMFAYEQCLLCLGHHPDIWYEAASYLEQASKLLAEKGVRLILLLSSACLVHFNHKSHCESKSSYSITNPNYLPWPYMYYNVQSK